MPSSEASESLAGSHAALDGASKCDSRLGVGQDFDTDMPDQGQSSAAELTQSASPRAYEAGSWNLPHAVWEVRCCTD